MPLGPGQVVLDDHGRPGVGGRVRGQRPRGGAVGGPRRRRRRPPSASTSWTAWPGGGRPAAERALGWLLAFAGPQRHIRLRHVAIRHWDGYWFGLRRPWGDAFPHYWSALTAVPCWSSRTSCARSGATGWPRPSCGPTWPPTTSTPAAAAPSCTPPASTASPPTGPTRSTTTRTGRWSTPCARASSPERSAAVQQRPWVGAADGGVEDLGDVGHGQALAAAL